MLFAAIAGEAAGRVARVRCLRTSLLVATFLVLLVTAVPASADERVTCDSTTLPSGFEYDEECEPVYQGNPDDYLCDSEANSGSAGEATLLFIPGPIRSPRPVMAADFEQLPGFAVGLFSPTLGRYTPMQMMLDISQGSRVASSLYKPATPPPVGALEFAGGTSLLGWSKLVDRAREVPGNIVPGLFGCALESAASDPVWISYDGSPTLTAVAAANLDGFVSASRSVPLRNLRSALLSAQRDRYNTVVVGTLPPGGEGYGIARRLAASDPDRLIVLVQAPPDPARTRLLTIAVRGLGGDGGLTSATTRRNGLVAATDIAPTILEHIGSTPPDDMNGQPIESAPRLSAEELGEMNDRLALVAGRRAPLGVGVLMLGSIFLIFLLGFARMTGRFPETARFAQRLVGLAVFWLPVLLLITAAMRPSRAVETDVAVFGSLILAWLTDKLVAWPRALWVPALATILAHAFDFLFLGAELTGESLLGSNPLYGARFFGVGNELEAVIVVTAVVGTGAAMCDRRLRRPALWFALGGLLLMFFLGAGRLGADVGGVIYVAAAFGAAALYAAKLRMTPLRVIGLIAVPVVALALIGALDAVSGGESHLTRTVFEAQSAGDLWQVVERRFSASVEGARTNGVWVLVVVSILLLIWAWLRRERLFSRLTEGGEDSSLRRPLRAGLVGGTVGTVVGAAANDSGPAILIIGTIYLAMGLLYLRGRPVEPG